MKAFPDPGPDAGYRLIDRRERDLLFVIDREVIKTPDLMAKLERAFEKRLTTRNWSTMEKVAAAWGSDPTVVRSFTIPRGEAQNVRINLRSCSRTNS